MKVTESIRLQMLQNFHSLTISQFYRGDFYCRFLGTSSLLPIEIFLYPFKIFLSFNSCANYSSYNTYADFWHAYAKGLETTSWKHIVVKLIWPKGRKGQKWLSTCQFVFISGPLRWNVLQKQFSKYFYCTKSFVLKFQGESLQLFMSYHGHFRSYRQLRSIWHARAKNQHNC